MPSAPSVYLAGPTVFEPDPATLFDRMKAICARHGLVGVAPLDGQVGLAGHPPGVALARAIVTADIALMHRVDGALFCLDGFRRGPEMDPGTAFEIGYMHALGKTLAGWTRDLRPYPARVAAFFAGTFGLALAPTAGSGMSGAWRDPDGVLVHSEGCYQNAMTQMAIALSGGEVAADPDWAIAFDRAAAQLATRLGAAALA